MTPSKPVTTQKKNHALRKLVGSVVVAGAVFAAEKMIEKQHQKKRRPAQTK